MSRTVTLDAIDWKILRELQGDGGLTNVELARRVGLTPPPCLRRVHGLQEAGLIRGYGTPAVRIVGHTDAGGDADFNRRLSQRRAQAVREYLVSHYDIEARLITTEGYGESRPVATNETLAGRLQNRRIEIYLKP